MPLKNQVLAVEGAFLYMTGKPMWGSSPTYLGYLVKKLAGAKPRRK